MRVVVIGATGTIGHAVADALQKRGHEVVRASRKSSPPIDIEDAASVRAFFEQTRDVDAVVTCAGEGAWGPLSKLGDDDFERAVRSKLMGQVNVIRVARERVRGGGSITVTTGVLAHQPTRESAAFTMVNCGLEGFVSAAVLDSPRGVRLNVVSPPWVKETLRALKMDESQGLSAADVAKSYVAAVEGKQNGEVLESTRFV